MTNLTKKIVAIVTTVTCAVWMMGPGVANALTAAELQAMIDSLLAQIATLQAQLSQVSTGGTVTGCSITSFTRNLTIGSSGNDVKCLQIILNSDAATQIAASGVGSSGNETTYFGPLTKTAVIKFQNKYASAVLTPLGLTAGTGFVGAKSIVKLNTMIGVTTPATPTTPTTPTTPISTTATVSLAADTPAAKQTALAATDAIATKIKFTGGTADYTVSKIVIKRGGVAADEDVAAIKLYDGVTQVGSSQALNTNTHKATFSGLNWTIPAGTTKYLTVKVSVAAKGTAIVGDSIVLGIDSASEITSTATLTGTFPINGNALTIAGISVGELFVIKNASPALATILSGAVEQEIAAFTFEASSSEAVSVHKIAITHVGSAAGNDISNLKLKYAGAQIGSIVPALDLQNQAVFDLSSSPLEILAGASKIVYVYCDVAAGIWTARTIQFEITQYTDVTAYGANSGGAIEAAQTDTVAFAKTTGQVMTIGQGSLTVNVDAAYNPASQTYVKGTSNRLISAFKFSAGSREGVRVVKLKLKVNNGSGVSTDISNITLWDGSTQIAGPVSLIGSYATFGSNTIGWDTTGLFDVAKSSNKTIQVKGDIPSGATTGRTLDLDIAAYSDIWLDGLDSKYDITQDTDNIVLTSGNGNLHTIAANGALSLSLSANTPPAQTYIKGTSGQEMMRLNLTADSGEDISVSSLTVGLGKTAGGASDAASGDFTNVKLLKMDGTQLGSTQTGPSTEAAFSFSLTVPASETVTLKVIADIPTGTTMTTANVRIEDNTHITSTGVSSSATITETVSSVIGKDMTIGEGSLTISAAASPGDQNIIIGSTEIPVLGLVMTAGSAEDIRVTRIKLTACSRDAAYTGDQDSLARIALWDGSTVLTAKKGWDASVATTVTFTASDFLNSQGISINKSQQKVITVKADIPSTGVAERYIALGITTSTNQDNSGCTVGKCTDDVTFVGLDSNTTPTTTLGYSSAIGGVNFTTSSDGDASVNYIKLYAKGTLTLASNADTPVTDIVTVGANNVGRTGVSFLKVDFTAAREAVDVKAITIERVFAGNDLDFASVSLWDGATQLGVSQTLANAGLDNSSTTFTFSAGSYWRIPSGTTKTLTVKANLKGVKTADQSGVTSGNTVKLCLASSTDAIGASSGLTISGNTAIICGNYQILHQSKPVIAAASLPDTVFGAKTAVLYRWTVTADGKGDIGWKKVIFDVSGSIHDASYTYTVGYGSIASGGRITSVIAMGSTTGGLLTVMTPKAVIATSTMHVYDVTTGVEIEPTTTDTGFYVHNYVDDGGARVGFVAKDEQIIAAGTTKTYELQGDISQAGLAGDSLSFKITKRSTATTTGSFVTVVGGGWRYTTSTDTPASFMPMSVTSTVPTFVWSDRSGVGGTHTMATADWSQDFKVSGLSTATLTLTHP